MSSGKIRHLYFEWLCRMVCVNEDQYQDYRDMLHVLYEIEFTYGIPRDANREEDGFELRDRFVDDNPDIDIRIMERALAWPCSVLEVLVALADRGEIIMSDPEIGDRTAKWFWTMIDNLMLGGMDNRHFDEAYVRERIDIFLQRKYAWDGSEGGLFVIDNPRKDLRKTELWYQMNWYLSSL